MFVASGASLRSRHGRARLTTRVSKTARKSIIAFRRFSVYVVVVVTAREHLVPVAVALDDIGVVGGNVRRLLLRVDVSRVAAILEHA